MKQHDNRTIVKGALVLTIAGIVSKILSAAYRIPLQNLTGDIGFYIYQQVYPILGIVTILALYGFPTAVSSLAARTQLDGKTLTFRQFYFPIFLILFVVSGGFFTILFYFGHDIAMFIGDEQLATIYQLASFAFLFIPFMALLRGVTQGSSNMKPTAYSQVGEQVVRVTIIIIAAVIVSYTGGSPYQIGFAASIATMAGATAASGILLLCFWKQRGNNRRVENNQIIPWGTYIRTILLFGFVASFTHMILLLAQVADSLSLLPTLMEFGHSKIEAMTAKGILDRGQPLIQLGAVLGSSFAMAFIPSLVTQSTTANQSIKSALKLSFYLAAGATIGLCTIFNEVNILLYKDNEGTFSLQILSLSVLLSALAITASMILQGIGRILYTASFIFGTFLLKIALNHLLVPYWGITGSAVATVLSLLLLCVILFYQLKRTNIKLALLQDVKWHAFLIASFSMVIYLVIFQFLLPNPFDLSRFTLFLEVFFLVGTGGILYLFILIRLQAFTDRELAMFPLSSLLSRMAKEEKK
ncbi:oligosaccharide flippase family protein [Virgibacillus soli]|uniref:Oligosaccharide flippase family protein n=1 Tax=Paracerasibacillus soli TaxID=480284 RepID=A0ABU5CW12_9BACI|nr:oligosaccharide flippase family protein [Virgibacillus soli]MDY0410007.1 oligosaccharide flippase family protein [Virgibacillus soli]